MQEEFVTVDGSRIRYLKAGSGKRNLILIHGLGASAERWDLVIPSFGKHFTVYVPDLIGFQHFNRRSTLSEFRQQMRHDRALPRSGQARNPDREGGLI